MTLRHCSNPSHVFQTKRRQNQCHFFPVQKNSLKYKRMCLLVQFSLPVLCRIKCRTFSSGFHSRISLSAADTGSALIINDRKGHDRYNFRRNFYVSLYPSLFWFNGSLDHWSLIQIIPKERSIACVASVHERRERERRLGRAKNGARAKRWKERGGGGERRYRAARMRKNSFAWYGNACYAG